MDPQAATPPAPPAPPAPPTNELGAALPASSDQPIPPQGTVNHGHRLLAALVNGAHQVGQTLYDVNNPGLTVQRQQQSQDQLKQIQQQHDDQYRKMIFDSISDPNSTPEQRMAGGKLLQHLNDPGVPENEKLNAITGYISAFHQPSELSTADQAKAARIKAGLEPNADTTYKTDNAPAKPVQEPKPLESGGVLYGVSDPSTGKQYLASQMNDPNTPQNIKEIWKTVQGAQAQKKQEADKKEEDRDKRFLESQANIASRMGRTEEWQAKMADYREQLAEYKPLSTQAEKTQELADTYAAQYQQPGNHSATDTALLTDYTSVLAQGGRKTQAEIALARNIGNFELNTEQKIKKFTTGELPEELRKMYLDYIQSAAKTQRDDANKIKPEPPSVSVPEGPKTKALKQQAKGGWTAPADAPPAPKADGKVLKADGKVIAVSKGGQWVEPSAH